MGMLRSTYHRLAESNIQREYSQEEIEKYTLMYKNSIENKEEIKNKIDTIKEKLDKNTKINMSSKKMFSKFDELEDIVRENTILIKKIEH